jgi:hypothetical protein
MVLVDDEVLAVDGVAVAGLGRAAVRDLMLGARDTQCELTIRQILEQFAT